MPTGPSLPSCFDRLGSQPWAGPATAVGAVLLASIATALVRAERTAPGGASTSPPRESSADSVSTLRLAPDPCGFCRIFHPARHHSARVCPPLRVARDPGRNRCSRRLLPRCMAAFPVRKAGRHPRLHFTRPSQDSLVLPPATLLEEPSFSFSQGFDRPDCSRQSLELLWRCTDNSSSGALIRWAPAPSWRTFESGLGSSANARPAFLSSHMPTLKNPLFCATHRF